MRLRSSKLRLISLTVLLIGGIFSIYVFFSNWKQFRAQHLEINGVYIALAFFLYSIAMLLTATAWHTLLRAIGIQIGFRVNLRLYALSCLPRSIPGFIWVFASRSLLYQEQNIPPTVTVAAMAVENVLLALTGLTMSVITLASPAMNLLNRFQVVRFVPLIASVLLLILVALVLVLKYILRRFLSSSEGEYVPQLNKRGILLSILWMFLAWSSGGVVLFAVGRSITSINWTLLPLFIGIWGFSGAVSLTIGIIVQGFGLREVTMGALLSTVMLPFFAVALAIAFRLLLIVGDVVWALFFIWATRVSITSNKQGAIHDARQS